MRTTGFLPVVYHLSNVGQTASFPGARRVQPILPEPATFPSVVVSDDNKQVVYLEEKHGEEPLSVPVPDESTTKQGVAKNSLKDLQERRKTRFAIYLAVVAGAMDVVCFQKFGCFAHLMTGNTVKCLTAATEMQWVEMLFYATMVASYTAGAASFRMVDILNEKRGGKRGKEYEGSTLRVLGGILLPVFAFSEGLVQILRWPAVSVAFLWSFGNGIVNASAMNAMGVVTNAVTGHWNRIGVASMDKLLLGERNEVVKTSYRVLAATALSVVATGFLTKVVGNRFKFGSLISPSGLLIGLVYFIIFRWYGSRPRQR